MKALEFREWLLRESEKGNITKETELQFFADYGDVGNNTVEIIEFDKEGNIVLAAHD